MGLVILLRPWLSALRAWSLVLLVLVAGSPLHEWIHDAGDAAPLTGTSQVHDGDCHHQPDDGEGHGHSCHVCLVARVLAPLPGAVAIRAGTAPPASALQPTHAPHTGRVPSSVLGARGPPALS